MGNLLYQLLGSLGGTFILYGVFTIVEVYYNEWTSPIRDLPGPKSASWIWGNFMEIRKAEHSVLQEKWVEQYGITIKYHAPFGLSQLYTMGPKALGHILMNNEDYEKPDNLRYVLGKIGSGVLVVEGEKHKQQNPAFGAAQIRELTEIFVAKSIQLRDAWAVETAKQGGNGKIEVLGWLNRATLDIIGLAGFGYDFDNLGEGSKPNELNEAFSYLFRANAKFALIPFLRAMFKPLRFLPAAGDAKIRDSRITMARIGNQLLQESKAQGLGTQQAAGKRRDLASLLVRANMSKDVPESQRMSDEDVLEQVPTFLVAGHETTRKLREELLSLNALPYLDAVVRETLCVHSPAPSTVRVAMRDDVLPLSKPFTDKRGKFQEGISIRKGQTIVVPILAMNRAKWIWGEDAAEFRLVDGIWGNMMPFLGGPRACIGYRFALVEMKALLFTLVRSFEFELAIPAEDVAKRSRVVQRPLLKSDPEGGNQLPMLIRPVSQAWM
ncbi:cytochrome P450 [Pluteus cervinus]|uniref:Cytochrome P450 n=1 Tax=Pluteus cervinus TaxID=181527 RepID=A0ACD3AJK1_9AGAR|nr:cytochrome P450 [Pluteus cervinus]